MWNSRLALIRLAARSYFCTCGKVSPSSAASFSWLIPNSMRRSRTREPTWMATGCAVAALRRPRPPGLADLGIGARAQSNGTSVILHTIVCGQWRRTTLNGKHQPASAAAPLCSSGRVSQAGQDRDEAGDKQGQEQPVAGAAVKRRRTRLGQRDVGIANRIEAGAREDAAGRIDDAADAVIGAADQRQPLLDRPGAGDREMLERAGAATIPRIIGHVQDPARTCVPID